MPLLEINRHPSPTELRWSGGLMAVFAGVAEALTHWRMEAPTAAQMIWTAGAALTAIYPGAPRLRRAI